MKLSEEGHSFLSSAPISEYPRMKMFSFSLRLRAIYFRAKASSQEEILAEADRGHS